jgi:hypothetical protein
LGLITEEVEVILHGKNIMYFELLGYPIPRTKKNKVKLELKEERK